MFWAGLGIGFIVGLIFGVFIMGLCAANGEDKEDDANR